MEKSPYQVRMYLLEQIAERELSGTDVIRSIGTKRIANYEGSIEGYGSRNVWGLVNAAIMKGFHRDEFII